MWIALPLVGGGRVVCDFLDLVYNKGLRLGSALLVAFMMLPFGSITRGPCIVLALLTQGVSTLV